MRSEGGRKEEGREGRRKITSLHVLNFLLPSKDCAALMREGGCAVCTTAISLLCMSDPRTASRAAQTEQHCLKM